jgi:rRNA maturation protein Rpf1
MARSIALKASEPFVARGRLTIDQLVDIARKRGQERINIICQSREKPAIIEVAETGKWRWLERMDIKNRDW